LCRDRDGSIEIGRTGNFGVGQMSSIDDGFNFLWRTTIAIIAASIVGSFVAGVLIGKYLL